MGVERGDDEVDEVYGQRKVEHKLGTGYEDKYEDGATDTSVDSWHEGTMGGLPCKTVQDPNKPKGPADGGVAAETSPAEQEICADLLAKHQGGEDDQDGGAGIVGELEEEDLGGDTGGR